MTERITPAEVKKVIRETSDADLPWIRPWLLRLAAQMESDEKNLDVYAKAYNDIYVDRESVEAERDALAAKVKEYEERIRRYEAEFCGIGLTWKALLQSQGGTVRVPFHDIVTVPDDAIVKRREDSVKNETVFTLLYDKEASNA